MDGPPSEAEALHGETPANEHLLKNHNLKRAHTHMHLVCYSSYTLSSPQMNVHERLCMCAPYNVSQEKTISEKLIKAAAPSAPLVYHAV